MNRSRTHAAKENIVRHFNSLGKKVFTKKDISLLLAEKHTTWKLANSESVNKFIDHLGKMQLLKTVKITCQHYHHSFTRYTWGLTIPIYPLGLSLKSNSYLSHQSALSLHGLINQDDGIVFINSEQSKKERSSSDLTQEGIDRAFQRKGRKSKYIFKHEKRQICLVNGMNTGKLGVEEVTINGERLFVTNLERTLIDVTVRPVYAGGCAAVLKAFKKAKGKVSVDQMITMLKKINYVYPYHQAIGFYMDRAGFDDAALNKIKKLGLEFDFYLDYAMKKNDYSKEWRIYYPKNLLLALEA